MHIIQAIILGLIQGLTEFIPVSSSGHLLLAEKLFGWRTDSLAFDVALHLGTLVALLCDFGRDWMDILSSFVRHVAGVPYRKENDPASSGRYLVPIIVASIPAALVGLKFESKIEAMRDRPWMLPLMASSLVIVGIAMILAERVGRRRRRMGAMNYVDYILIGVAQALALIPGVSRSGSTITMGLFRDLDRAAAARFSFLLSTPVIFGAGLKTLLTVHKEGLPAGQTTIFAVGFITAAVSGYLAIKFLMNYLKRGSLTVFAIYRFVLAAGVLGVFLSGIK